MPQKFNIVIADTSCFILLHKIDELQILKAVFKNIYTTSIIKKELGKPLPAWIKITDPKDQHYQNILELDIDKGEASAIALSLEMKNSLLILDDLKARKLAEKLHLDYTGTLGVIIKAKKSGLIKSVVPIITKIRKTNFRFSELVIRELLNAVGE